MKKILFVIDSLECAGAEKSLVTLLNLLDYSKLSVDLMLFGHGGELENLVPEEVNILDPLEYIKFASQSLKEAFLISLSRLDFKMLSARMKYSTQIRFKRYKNSQKARIFWQSVSDVIENNSKRYDVAISYAQGVPTFYVAEKVVAIKKIAWVNTSYRLNGKEREFSEKYYDLYHKIITVSESAREIFLETFPAYSNKTDVIYDINNPIIISKMANNGKGFDDYFSGIKLLTIGRFDTGKGYDIALEACKMLKEKGVNFRWYVLGKGPLKQEIEAEIIRNNLTNHFILLGVKSNPYPYIKDSDIYVQTSRFEGFGLAIAEARMLNIPVVTTRFDSVYNQMINEKNGLVVDMNSMAVCDGILRLIRDDGLRNNIIKFLEEEKKGNLDEICKIYRLIG